MQQGDNAEGRTLTSVPEPPVALVFPPRARACQLSVAQQHRAAASTLRTAGITMHASHVPALAGRYVFCKTCGRFTSGRTYGHPDGLPVVCRTKPTCPSRLERLKKGHDPISGEKWGWPVYTLSTKALAAFCALADSGR